MSDAASCWATSLIFPEKMPRTDAEYGRLQKLDPLVWRLAAHQEVVEVMEATMPGYDPLRPSSLGRFNRLQFMALGMAQDYGLSAREAKIAAVLAQQRAIRNTRDLIPRAILWGRVFPNANASARLYHVCDALRGSYPGTVTLSVGP